MTVSYWQQDSQPGCSELGGPAPADPASSHTLPVRRLQTLLQHAGDVHETRGPAAAHQPCSTEGCAGQQAQGVTETHVQDQTKGTLWQPQW